MGESLEYILCTLIAFSIVCNIGIISKYIDERRKNKKN